VLERRNFLSFFFILKTKRLGLIINHQPVIYSFDSQPFGMTTYLRWLNGWIIDALTLRHLQITHGEHHGHKDRHFCWR
jgi:hypothetical protein